MLHYRAEVDSTWSDVATTRNREKVDKEARSEEMEMKRADNILKHEDEILSRPRKTWHQSTGRQIAAKFGKMNFEKMLAGSQKRRPKQTQSNKIVNATYMKPSKPPQIITDKDSLPCDDSDTLKRRMPSASQAEEDNYDVEESNALRKSVVQRQNNRF